MIARFICDMWPRSKCWRRESKDFLFWWNTCDWNFCNVSCCAEEFKLNSKLNSHSFSSWTMAYLTPESESSTTADLSWTQLIATDKPRPTIVRIDDKPPKEMNPEEVQLNSNENTTHTRRERRESLIHRHLGTFHRHLRMSLKAVSESPGPLSR